MCYLPLQSQSLARARADLRSLPDRIARTVRDPILQETIHRVVSDRVDAALSHLIAAEPRDGEGDLPAGGTFPEC